MAKVLGCSLAEPLGSGTAALASRRLTTSLPEIKIRRRVFEPCLAIPMAASTPLLAFIRSLATPAGFLIVPLALIRSRTIRTARATRPTVILRSITTPAATTRPLVLLRSIATPPAAATRPTGAQALYSNTTGAGNTANSSFALFHNTTGNNNTATGSQALQNNTTGAGNTAYGDSALFNNTTGALNTALGLGAGSGVTTANNVIAIGTGGANVSNTCFIGNIFGVTTQNANAIPVLVDSAGQLGTASSSRRFKKEIKPMDSASESILALKPVAFYYKSDKRETPQFGLIAEEVAKVNPDLVVRDENGEIYTVRYDAVNAMLLNEFLKEHGKVQELEATVSNQQKQIEALTAGLQKVSAQLELNKAAPQTVVNNQ